MTGGRAPGRAGIGDLLRQLAALEAMAVSLWLLPASVHIVG